ncbi:hypothetical protein CDEST_04532 [Colletotrichum destructivum]|uniref:Uncharacterized protein n=1 Tax=Colletotrichum destructivum TaxID=34406 RepID=A0AAX4I820_9PEZI|nr:hypothetical protein CDEST_04532 [Colletotrichum destructivum]
MVYHSLPLVTVSLAALAAASPIGVKPRQPNHQDIQAVDHDYGMSPASKMIPGVGTNWKCITRIDDKWLAWRFGFRPKPS